MIARLPPSCLGPNPASWMARSHRTSGDLADRNSFRPHPAVIMDSGTQRVCRDP
jgi:hypothetical protein